MSKVLQYELQSGDLLSTVLEPEAPEIAEANAAPVSGVIPSDVARNVVHGTSALGLSVLIERGTGFLANILAARLAGVSTFGAYSLGLSTANNIATYAAGGIGTTATRFSGRYPFQSPDYGRFARALSMVAVVSACVAAMALVFGAGPIAHLLKKPELSRLLRWAALSAAGMIVLESARGFFVGQRRIRALVVLSLTVGCCMLLVLPAVALSHRPVAMLIAQGSIITLAVVACLVFAGPLRLIGQTQDPAAPRKPFRSILREVWGYGLIQLTGLLTANLAGWWVTILVARGDATLAQMGFFAVASQFRNLAGLLPGLLTEGSFATMATEDAGEAGESDSMPHRLMSVCTFAATASSMAFASLGIVLAPWILRLVYGRAYQGAALAVAVGLSVAVLQMGNSPTSARVSIVSIRSTAAINTTWAVLTAALGALLMLRGGNAAGAMAIFLCAHVVMALQVLWVLRRRDRLPGGLTALLLVSTGTMLTLCGLAWMQAQQPEHAAAWSAVMLITVGCSALLLHGLARRHGWLSALPVRALGMKLRERFQRQRN